MDLSYRDAFADHAGVSTDLIASLGPDIDPTAPPLVTIAIPTFRRPELLVEAVRSALAQDFDQPVEVIVVDNDPDEARYRAIIASLPQEPARPVRYYVNRENIGMFGNWNRCIELARGTWLTILNDDDLLLPQFLARSFRILRRRPEIDGLVCKKILYNWDQKKVAQSFAREALKRVVFRWRFDRDNVMHATPRKLFFGNELDNGLGFLFRRATAIELGGYREEDFPASDFFFYIRFTLKYKLYWLNELLAYLGIGDNESVRKSTIMRSIALANAYYKTMSEHFVPASWADLRPQLTANQVLAYRQKFGIVFTPEELRAIEEDVGSPLPPPSYQRIRQFRLLHRGF